MILLQLVKPLMQRISWRRLAGGRCSVLVKITCLGSDMVWSLYHHLRAVRPRVSQFISLDFSFLMLNHVADTVVGAHLILLTHFSLSYLY